MVGNIGRVTLQPGREKSVLNHHPWLFSGAVASADCADGDICAVYDAKGRWLASGYYNSHSQIRVRLLSWDQSETIERAFWQRRIERSLSGRQRLPGPAATAMRLINAETDGLPGLVADLYVGEPLNGGHTLAVLVIQALTLAVEQRKQELASLTAESLRQMNWPQFEIPQNILIYERSDVDVRRLEGLAEKAGPLQGETPPVPLIIKEDGLRFAVDIVKGHKTGHYLDQRNNRLAVARYCRGAEVLNVFSYTGGFSVHALAQGARHVTDIDSSRPALELGQQNSALNNLPLERHDGLEGDAFTVLRGLHDDGQEFDAVILDPPKFAYRTEQVQSACRGYKDINISALRLVRPGGILATFSCSGLVTPDLFQKVIFGAAVDSGREVQILERLWQAPDHPVALTFPEAEYLKGFLCRVW